MKKKLLKSFLMIILSVCIVLQFAACGKDSEKNTTTTSTTTTTKAGGNSGTTTSPNNTTTSTTTNSINTAYEAAKSVISNLGNSSDKTGIENNIQAAVGADITLPTGTTYSSTTYSSSQGVYYNVTVQGTSTTYGDYYDAIKSDLTSAGWVATDSENTFNKVSGTVVYVMSLIQGTNANDVILSCSVVDLTNSGDYTTTTNNG